MAAKMTQDEWYKARERWESDPRDGYAWLRRDMNLPVSEVAIFKRARKELWAKKVSLRTVVEMAQYKADQKLAERPLSDSEIVEVRAKILETHRREWQEHRERFPLEAIVTTVLEDVPERDVPERITLTQDGERLAKTAKIMAETIKIRQIGERESWGLDAVGKDVTQGMSTIEQLEAMYALAMRRSDELQVTLAKDRETLADALD